MNKMTLKLASLAFLIWAQLLVGCGDDEANKPKNPPVDKACMSVSCDDGGVCKAGECVNATDCEGEDKNCIAGYLCSVANNTCVPRNACNPSQPCARGTCDAGGACVNADSCADSGQCLQGFACGDAAKCISDPCQDEANQCARGICQVGTGACVNAQACSSTTEGTQCLENFRCIGGECKDEAGFCGQTDCSATGGVCNFAATGMDDRCVNAQPGACGGDDANCLKGFFCDEADNTCKPDQCEVDGCEEDGGVCDKASGSCVNPATCTGAADCLKENFCVAEGGQNVCKPKAQACAAANCTGLQLCTNDDAGFTVSCGEPETCQNALDCLGTRVCGEALVCADAVACVPDANEPNDDSASATDYFVARQGRLVRGSLCPQDVDVIAFDTRQDVEETGRLVVEVQVASSRLVGQGELKAELMYGGNVVQSGTTTDGKVRLEQPVTLAFVGLYELKLSQEGTLSEQGIDYQVSMDLIDNQVVQACMSASALTENTVKTSSTLSGASTAIAASCGDPQGKAFEDIYTITLASKSYLSVFVDAGDMSNVGVSLRRECLSNESELPGACADNEGPGGIERVEALLEPGTYFVVVQGGDETLGGTYEITWTRRDVNCTFSDSKCVSMSSAEICRPDGQGFNVQSCDEGCNMNTGACRPLKGEVCGTAQVVNETTPLDKYVVQWGKLRNDYGVAVTGCVPSTDGTVNATSGPDQAFRVVLPPNHVLVASVTQESNAVGAKTDASLYVVEDCLNTDGTCKIGVNGGSESFGKSESLFINNDSAMAKTYLVVVDTASASSYVNSLLNLQVLPKVCEAGGFACAVDGVSMKASTQKCNVNGTMLDAPIECPESDFCSVRNNCGDDDVCLGARLVTSGFTATPALGTSAYSDTVDISCQGVTTPSGAEEAFYAVEVPDGNVLRVSGTSDSTFDDPAIAIFESCSDLNNTCLAGASGELSAEAFWRNDTGASKTVFVVFSMTDSFISSSSDFSIEIDVRAPECTVPGEVICDMNDLKTCNSAFVYDVYACDGACGTVTPKQCDNPRGDICFDTIKLAGTSGSISGTYQDATNASELPDGITDACEIPDLDQTDGPDRIFEVRLKDKEMIEARLAGGSSSVLYIGTTCGDPTASCLANQPDQGSGLPVRYLNTTGADQTVFLTADYTFNTTSAFTLNYTITPGLSCVPRGRACDAAGTAIEVCKDDGSAVLSTLSCPMGSMCARGRCQAEPAADICTTAPTVVSQYSVIMDTGAFTSNQNPGFSSCAGGSTTGVDSFHKILVPAGDKLVVETISVGADLHSIYVFDDCANVGTSCLKGERVDSSPEDYNGRLEWINNTVAAKTVIVAVDMSSTTANDVVGISFETRGPECTTPGARSCDGDRLRTCGPNLFYSYYNCDGTCGTVAAGRCDTPSGDQCQDVALLAGPNGTVQGSYSNATNQSELPSGISGVCKVIEGDETDGPDRFYEIVLANGEMLRAILTSSGTTTSSSLYLTSTCADPSSCLANDSNPGDGATAEYLNTTGASQSVFITVDYLFASSSNSFTLDYEVVTGLTCVPNSYKCDGTATGIDRCRLDGSGYEPTVSCRSGETCQNGACSPTNPAIEPANVCSTAPLVPGGYIALKDFRFATSNQNPGSASCAGQSTSGPDMFHKLEVPSLKRLKVETIAFGADSHSIYVVKDCMTVAASCLAGQRVSSGAEDYHGNLVWYNDDITSSSQTVTVGVDANSTSGDGFYGMRFEVLDPECVVGTAPTCVGSQIEACSAIGELTKVRCDTSTGGSCGTTTAGRCDNPSGDFCADPFVVNVPPALPATLTFTGDFADFTATQNNIGSGGCTGFSANGPDAIYEVILPPSTTVKATLDSPVAKRDISLYFLDTCGGGNSACLGGSDKTSLPEIVSYTNSSTTSAKTIYVIADAFSSFTTSGDFKLDLEFTAAP